MWDAYFVTLFLFFGLSLGSFFNVVVYRLPRGMSLVSPRSHCPSCKRPIGYFDNIPVLSYLLLKGRCRHCGSTISGRYPLVESVTALLYAGLFIRFGLSISTLVYGVLFAFLIPIIFIDIDRQIIPDRLTAPGFILGMVLVPAFHFLSWRSMVLGSAVTGVFIWLLGLAGKTMLKKETLGFGDVKMLVMTGIYLGFPGNLISLFLGAIAAMVLVVIGMLLKKMEFSNRIPFGPFIALGIIVYVYVGPELVNWYLGLF